MNIPGPAKNARIYIKPGHTDMRKSVNSLSAVVENELRLNPFIDGLFAFCDRKKDIVKLLYWERNGFCIWYKRLEKDRFPWPQSEDSARELTPEQLRWLLDGIDFRRAHRDLKYSRVT